MNAEDKAIAKATRRIRSKSSKSFVRAYCKMRRRAAKSMRLDNMGMYRS